MIKLVRLLGGASGLLVGWLILSRLRSGTIPETDHRGSSDARQESEPSAPSSVGRGDHDLTFPTSQEVDPATSTDLAALRQLSVQQAQQIIEQAPVVEAVKALTALQHKRQRVDFSKPEMIRILQLSQDDLRAEIKVVADETASYDADGEYAPVRHLELYRRVNMLYDAPKIPHKENLLLDQCVKRLDELAIQHVELSIKRKDIAEAARTANTFGEWSFRLAPKQEKRLTTALRTIVPAK